MSKRKTPKPRDIAEEWTEEAQRLLLGRRITDVEYRSGHVCLRLDDGTAVWPVRDDEGNGPGALHGITGDGKPVLLPTLRGDW